MSLVGQRIGNYVVQSKLGEGGMGAVYLGTHPLIGKKVAIKVLLEELGSQPTIVERFFREAKSVNDIGHQNIVDIVDFGTCRLPDAGADTIYLIMEFLEGESLAQRIRREGLASAQSLHVARQCCSGLAASHAKGIVHRDLKPDNIYLVTRGGDRDFVKILDFGIAKLTGDVGGVAKTRTGMVFGTPTYMSPEQCDGRGQIDARSDIYSLGIVMYELWTGRTPFVGQGLGEILAAHITTAPPPPTHHNPSLPHEIEAIILRTLEKSPAARFASMTELEAALRACSPSAASSENAGAATLMSAIPQPRRRGEPLAATEVARPTTLSGATAELTPGRASPSRGRAGLLVVLVVVLLAGGSAVAWKLRGGPAAPVAETAPPPAPAEVRITIGSNPPGATVVRPGLPDDKTPATLVVKQGSETFDVIVKLDGWKPTTFRNVPTGEDTSLFATLQKEAPVAPPPPPTPAHVSVGKPEAAKSRRHQAPVREYKDGFMPLKF